MLVNKRREERRVELTAVLLCKRKSSVHTERRISPANQISQRLYPDRTPSKSLGTDVLFLIRLISTRIVVLPAETQRHFDRVGELLCHTTRGFPQFVPPRPSVRRRRRHAHHRRRRRRGRGARCSGTSRRRAPCCASTCAATKWDEKPRERFSCRQTWWINSFTDVSQS